MRLLIFFKILLIFKLSLCFGQETCPQGCECVRNAVKCLHKDLNVVPKAPINTHTLDLRFNKIYDIAPGVFSHLHRLRSLLLNDNQLRALRSGAFHGLRRLKNLYLYRNHIQTIDPDVFQGMLHLEQLYLHVNEIHEVQADTFSHMPRLERLYLHNNRLERIPEGAFRGMPKLQKLRLDSNALICDCHILWLVRMLSGHTDMNVAATCYGPPQVLGTSLKDMQEHKMHCKKPEIHEGPEDVLVEFGKDAVFTCTATGSPEPEIVWYRDSAVVSLDGTRYEVQTNGSLMIHNVDNTDIGIFECMAKNPSGEVHSRPARMMMHHEPKDNDIPVFKIRPKSQVINKPNKRVRFDCVASGNPAPHIAWYFKGTRILLDARTDLHKNGSVFIDDVQYVDAGDYTCEAENIHGTINASAELQVLVPPSFIIVPKDTTVFQGEKTEFTCMAQGSPKPVITWFLNTMTLPASDNYLLENENEKFTILEVTKEDAGIYHCRAENSEGITEISAVLNVEEFKIIPPRIVLKPGDTDAYKETSVQLPCEVESDPPATITWTKDGSSIILQERIVLSLIGSLTINNLTIADTGRYECLASNEYGRDTASAFLSVKDRILPGEQYVNIAIIEATRDVDQAIARTVDGIFHNNTEKKDVHDLFRIAHFPNEPARTLARAAEIYELTLDKVKGFIQQGLKVTSAEPFNYNNVLSRQHLELIAQLSGCTAHREQKNCTDVCFHNKYRSIDGSCNNFEHPTWGSSLTGFRRILFPIYENGFSQPIGWNKGVKYNGLELPSARSISTAIITTTEISEDIEISHMTMQWGQWLDHDLDHALPSVSSQTWDGVDCKKTCDYAPPCFPIDVPKNDPRISNRRCIDFIRTSSVCGSGVTSVLFGSLQPREQINQLTSFIDASQVYGFESAVAKDLRDFSNDNGLLRVGVTFPERKPLLPTTGINAMDCRLNLAESDRPCFVAGDIRANEQIGLAAMHTIWMREHNRLALELKSLNSFWDGDRVYQEARKIVGAQIQFITYERWLPLVLGKEGFKKLGTYKGYDSSLNPSISNVFATAALRFGHSMINPILHRYDENFDPIPQGHLLLRHAFFAPWRLVDEGGVDPLLRGMFTTPAKLKTSTQNLNSELTEKLFYSVHAVALDLAAINIQRGRDHAIPPYTKWRQVCNMTEINDFDDLSNEISDKSVRDKLKQLYGSVHNIDVWVGGILEDQVKGGKVGPLFSCLLIEQFKRLRDGDRFWFENPNVFKPEQLEQIRKTSLARVLCDNGDNIDTIGENVFLIPEVQDGLISCDDLPSIDIRFWADCETCSGNGKTNAISRSRRAVSMENRTVHDARLFDLEVANENLKGQMAVLIDRLEHLEALVRENN